MPVHHKSKHSVEEVTHRVRLLRRKDARWAPMETQQLAAIALLLAPASEGRVS